MIVKRNFDPRKVIRYVWREVAVAIAVSAAVYALHEALGVRRVGLSFAPLGLLGTALSIFLGFRASSSFARWGEAAAAWASITSASRVFTRLVVTFVDAHRHTPQYRAEAAEPFKRALIDRHLAWVNALRLSLRGERAWEEVERFLSAEDRVALATRSNKPAALLVMQGRQIYEGMASGVLQGFDSFQMEGQLAALSALQATCERLERIPVPRQYDYFTRLFVRVFAIAAPFFLVKTLAADGVAWLVVPLSALLAFLFTTIERTGAVNEDPFAGKITDVPLTAMCRDIERDARELLGEEPPARLVAEDGYLM
jgi:putative membrane protein